MSLRAAAVESTLNGFRVFPLQSNGKTPALETDWQTLATDEPARAEALWTCPVMGWGQPFNIGIAAGSGLVVVDIDNKETKRGSDELALLEMLHEAIPPTRTVRTPSGGEHRYFRSAIGIGNSASRIAPGIDVRGEGGYVVGPGSVIDGRPYEVIDGSPVAELPEWLLTMAATAPRAPKAAPGETLVEVDQPGAIARAIEWLRNRTPDHGTYAVACRVKDFGISAETCKALVKEHWVDARGLAKSDDHVDFRVENAYRYGQNAIGVASAEAEFEAVDNVIPQDKPRLYYERWRDVSVVETAEPLIDGWIDCGSMVVTYGESNVGKTNVLLSQAVAIATGQPWAERHTLAGLVVYVAAEGGRGIRKRIEAYKRRFGVRDVPLALVPCPIDLLRPAGDTKALIELVGAAEADFGRRCVLVVIDTLSRALAGGNENAPDDMGALVKHCDRIRAATGACVNIVHHSGKNAAAGARGHSLLRAAADTEIEITPSVARATKQRDMDAPRPVSFVYEPVPIGADRWGAAVSGVVAHVTAVADFEPVPLTVQQAAVHAALEGLVREKAGVSDKDDTPEAAAKMKAVVVTTAEIRKFYDKKGSGLYGDSPIKKNTFGDNLWGVVHGGFAVQLEGKKGKPALWSWLPYETVRNCTDVQRH